MAGASPIEALYLEILKENLSEVVSYRQRWLPYLTEHESVEISEMPRLIPQDSFQLIENRSTTLIDCLLRAPEAVFGGNLQQMSETLGIDELKSPLFQLAYLKPSNFFVARPDGVWSQDQFQFFEHNITSAVNGFADKALGAYYAAHPVMEKLKAQYGFTIPSYYQNLAQYFKTAYEGKFIVIMATPPSLEEDTERRWMHRYLKEAGVDIQLATDSGLKIQKNGIYLDGRKVDLLYRTYIPAPLYFDKTLEPLLEAHINEKVELLHDPTEILYFDKSLLAVLSDPATNTFLTPQEKQMIGASLPWTRLLRTNPLEFENKTWDPIELLEKNQKRFVLKRGYGSSSRFVVIGPRVSADVWQKSIRLAQEAGNWIVQEFVASPFRQVPALLNHELKLFSYEPVDSPYIIDGKIAGLMTRETGWYTDPNTGNLLTDLGQKVSETIGISYTEKAE